MPASACCFTISATAARTRAASPALSTGTPSSLAYIMRIRSGGRGRLPVCVVRKRSLLRIMLFPLPTCDGTSLPADDTRSLVGAGARRNCRFYLLDRQPEHERTDHHAAI